VGLTLGGSRKLTLAKIHELLERLNDKEGDRYRVNDRVKLFVQEKNAGKSAALVRGVEQTDTDLVMFVDSDSFLEPLEAFWNKVIDWFINNL
jgi:hyaluronan synthase